MAIYNVTGKLVYEGVNLTTISTTHFARGVDYIKLWNGDQLMIDRLIKE